MKRFSILLAAKIADKPVRLYINGCERSRPRIETVVINKETSDEDVLFRRPFPICS